MRTFLRNFLEGPRYWALARLIVAGGTLIILGTLNLTLAAWLRQWAGLRFTGGWLEALWLFCTPTVAFALVFWAAALYSRDIFELKRLRLAARYLLAAVFGLGYPGLTIRNGRAEAPVGQTNLLLAIGGPGWLDVKLGNLVLLERGAGTYRLVANGGHFVRPFERIRQILDLRETYRKKPEVTAVTKDGLEIVLRDVEAVFRLDTDRQTRTDRNPYPYSTQAALAAAYNRPVEASGQQVDWGEAVLRMIVGQITAWVARQRLDRLTAPTGDDPRAAIRAQFNTPAAQQSLANLGAELVWVNIGHLDTPGPVDEQRIETWRSFWQSHARVTHAHAEALRVAYAELGRAEGQAEMLSAICTALGAAGQAKGFDDRFAELVLLRISRVLEAMAAAPGLAEKKIEGLSEPPSSNRTENPE